MQAFVSVGVELWLLEHVSDPQRVFVARSDYQESFGEDPPHDFIPVQGDSPTGSSEAVISPLFDLMRLTTPQHRYNFTLAGLSNTEVY